MSEEGGLRSDSVDAPMSLKSSQTEQTAGSNVGASAAVRGAPGDVGQLLRGAYRQTVDEAIPDDLMDLLNKLE